MSSADSFDRSVVQPINFAKAAVGISSATLHEAAGQTGALPAEIKPVSADTWVCGPAFTVRSPPRNNLWLDRAIYAARAGDVLVVDSVAFVRLATGERS